MVLLLGSFPSPCSATITINSRATHELGICLLRRCCYLREWKSKSTRPEDNFYPSEETPFTSTVFRKIQAFSQLRPASPALAETFQCSSLKNAVTECTCYGAGWFTHASDGLQKYYYFTMMPQVWCKHCKKSERQRLTPSLTDLYSAIYKFSIH